MPMTDTISQLHNLGYHLTGVAPMPPHPVTEAINAAIRKLAGFQPHRIVGEPGLADSEKLIGDALALCDIFDSVMGALGEYAASHLPCLDTSFFQDQMLGAIEGNATAEIEHAVNALIEDYEIRDI